MQAWLIVGHVLPYNVHLPWAKPLEPLTLIICKMHCNGKFIFLAASRATPTLPLTKTHKHLHEKGVRIKLSKFWSVPNS